ncbi:MAG: hypothetical protein C0505_05330 [Leptothrix sp. (in: Bacteria)]|nr:hypothetical protein [Leptothrix sp. (in: b-proteobacteria)]
MDPRIGRLESLVEDLRLTVATLQQRLDTMESKVAANAPVAGAATAQAPLPTTAAPEMPSGTAKAKDPYDPIAMLSLIGRLLLVLAGGFFLRAMTDAGVLAVPVGIGLAFVYAAVWLFMSDRAGAHGQVPNAVLHALAAGLIALPLAVEATTRFKVLGGTASAAVLAALSAGLLMVAWRRRLRAVSWIAVLGGPPTAAAILLQTGVVWPLAVYLVALGVAALWLSYAVDWWGSRWVAALTADAAVAGVALRAFAPEQRDTPLSAMLLILMLLLGYVGSTAIRTLAKGREVSPFEIMQTFATMAIALGGTALTMSASDAMPVMIGAIAVVLGVGCYGVAVKFFGSGTAKVNLYFYTTLALVLVVAGIMISARRPWPGAAFAVFGALTAGLWFRGAGLFTLLHSAAYLTAAGFVSGSFAYGLTAVVAGAQGAWATPDAVVLVMLAAAVLSAAFIAQRPRSAQDELAIAAGFVITLVCVLTVGGAVIGYIAPIAGGLPGGGVDSGVLASVRTGVLSLATLLIAWMGRHARLREWGWLVYPLLIGIGLKLLTQDFKHSRPSTLFIAMALYGAALIVAPRLRRSGAEAAGAPEARPEA